MATDKLSKTCAPDSIIFEYPFEWNKDKNQQHKIFLDNFIHVITLANKPLSIINALWPSYGVERITQENIITIAFHSFNNPANVWTIKESPVYGLYSIDKNGYSGWSEINQNRSKFLKLSNKLSQAETKEILEQYRLQICKGVSKYQQPKAATDLPEHFILFPLQVQTDSVAQLAYIDSLDVLERLNILSKKYQQHIIVKRHPWCQSNAIPLKLQILTQNNPYLTVSNTDITHLIQQSDAVISCNSGVSLEALICDKPVFCFGASEWEYASNSIQTLDEVEQVFTSRVKMNPSQEKFIAFLLSDYWVKFDDTDALKKRFDLICREYIPDIGTHVNSKEEARTYLERYLLKFQKSYTAQKNELLKIEKEYIHLVKDVKAIKKNPAVALSYFLKTLFRR